MALTKGQTSEIHKNTLLLSTPTPPTQNFEPAFGKGGLHANADFLFPYGPAFKENKNI